MTYRDFLGNALTADAAATARGIDDFVDGFLSYEARAANVLAAADAAPDNPLANAYAAMIWMFLESPDAAARAAPYLARAKAAAKRADARERGAIEFVDAWSRDEVPAALAIGAAVNQDFPRDLVIAKLRQYFHFNAGDFPAMLRVAEELIDANRDIAQMHGMIAFGYEQCHLLDEAEEAARRALSMKEREPWAQHALAHVMLTQGRVDEGALFLEAARPLWTGLNSFMSTHNHWHLALFYLSQGRFAAALDLYDEAVWGIDKAYSQDQVGAVSLLARIELAGGDVGARWSELANYLSARAHDAVLPFLSLQYLYGLGRAARPEADTLMAAIRRAADIAPPHARKAWAEAALPAAEGVLAHARSDHETAMDKLDRALPLMAAIGGSHAQRDLFEQIHLDALIRGGALSRAQQILELRRRHDPEGAPLNRALAEVYLKLGLPKEAAKARDRAAR